MKKSTLLSFIIVCLFTACSSEKDITVSVENTSTFDRTDEIVEVDYSLIGNRVELKEGESVIVEDLQGKQVPAQIVFEGESDPQKLIFPVTVASKEKIKFKIKTGKPETYRVRAYGRLVPERMDDICWENDRIAFRAYGPALEATGEISNGYDIWVKRTEEMVVDKRYRMELKEGVSYHQDNGDGLDYYKVGRTLGAGAMAPLAEDTLRLGNNFIKSEVLDNGPLRFTVRLTYAPYDVEGNQVNEIRIITLDAGSQLNKITQMYGGLPEDAHIAAGIVLHAGSDQYMSDANKGYAVYADPAEVPNGQTFVATVFPQPLKEIRIGCGHILSVTGNKEEGNIYYCGGGWTKWGFEDFDKWHAYVRDFSAKLRAPLDVNVR